MEQTKNDIDLTLERARELNREGFDWGHAWGKAWLERRIADWPSEWGDNLRIIIYGDFDPPNAELNFPELGITVYPEKVKNSVVRSAMCVLKATVEVTERSVPAILDAVRRINVLLGAWTLVEWGNGGCGWWCLITAGSMGGVATKLDNENLAAAIAGVTKLPVELRTKVDSALFWVREPRHLLMEQHRSDLLRIYSAYWNAFECLVDAVLIAHPLPKLSKTEKQKRIDEFDANRNGKLTISDIIKCYQDIVDPGFVGRACHALQVCFPKEAEGYANECFHITDRTDRLYDIRNAINHGDIDAENPEELLRVDSRLSKLWMIVWRMFGRLVPFPAPIESPSSDKDSA